MDYKIPGGLEKKIFEADIKVALLIGSPGNNLPEVFEDIGAGHKFALEHNFDTVELLLGNDATAAAVDHFFNI
jgi:hypothetical protein